MKFYDTNALLYEYDIKANEPFIMSNLTLKELQYIKNNTLKSEQVKYKARHLINWLMQNKDMYKVYNYQTIWDKDLKKYPILSDNNDSRIILTALKVQKQLKLTLDFITFDSNCAYLAQEVGLKTIYTLHKNEQYEGYKELYLTEKELADFYADFTNKKNIYNLLNNEYIILKDSNNTVIDVQRFINNEIGYTSVNEAPFNSKMFGKIKAKDVYQRIAMDSMIHNKITVIRGPAGTGKSLLSLGFLFDQLEKNKIEKIIIFCNTVATQGSAKLGYYPGSKNQKLLDSQIGNFLASKLGDKMAVQMLIDKGQLILLPMADIRGFDTTGLKAGIYITEAQNMSIDLMKLALQRVGEDSIVILDGDDKTQVDLGIYGGNNNGLRRVSKVFRGESIYGEVTLKNIYRSEIANIAEKM